LTQLILDPILVLNPIIILGERVNEKTFLIRVELTELENGVVTQCIGGVTAKQPRMLFFDGIPELIQPKIAILHLVDAGDNVEDMGRRVGKDLFYIRVTLSEWAQLSKESQYETDGKPKWVTKI
jgi:hypothetical protein